MSTLAAAEERWRLTIDNAPVGIALVGLDGTFLRANEALCRILGYSAEELVELSFQDLTHPDDLDADLDHVEELLAGEISSYRMRKRYVHADGHHIWTELSVGLVRNARGRPVHFVSHVADLTDEIEAGARIDRFNRELSEQKARLERSNADLEAFAMLASHDLQAPLATIRGYVELLGAEYEDVLDERATEWLDRTTQAVARMSELVSSLLDFSRVGSTDALPRELVYVPELVREIGHDLDQLIAASGASIECAPESPPVMAERGRLRQVLQNLLQNTIKYRHDRRPPHTLVAVQARDDGWLVTVTDNAVGIPAEHRDSVFAMFTRVSESGQGHGIGLAACRQIVERHGGSIWVEDNPAGPGSRFCFTLPR